VIRDSDDQGVALEILSSTATAHRPPNVEISIALRRRASAMLPRLDFPELATETEAPPRIYTNP
jgi:hypothetical protein